MKIMLRFCSYVAGKSLLDGPIRRSEIKPRGSGLTYQEFGCDLFAPATSYGGTLVRANSISRSFQGLRSTQGAPDLLKARRSI